ncbi:MAG: YCF48-related protein [Bacteroidales bacterium]
MKKHSITSFAAICIFNFAICIFNSNSAFAQCGIEASSNDTSIICGSSVQLDAQPKWVILNSGTTNLLFSVYFTNADTGYVVGETGTILKTTDGGTNWTTQTSGTSSDLWSVYFTNANTGYAVGGTGTILKTINGGTNWTIQTSGTTYGLSSVHFTNADTGYAVGGGWNGTSNEGAIFKTINGGNTWTAQTGTGYPLRSVYFTDTNTGYSVGENGTILKTINSGTNWTAQTSGTTSEFWSVYFTDANTGYVVARTTDAILKTTDGGTNWTQQPYGITTTFLFSVYFTNTDTGYVVGAPYTILKTTNGGATWKEQTSPTSAGFFSVHFPDANTGYAVGGYGEIIKLSAAPVSYTWSPANGLNATNISNPIANPTATTTYIVTATTANGCTAIDSVTINVNLLTANAGTDKTIICGGTAQLDNVTSNYTGTGTLTYNWSPTSGLNYDTIPNPTATVTSDTTYLVTVTTPNGCTAVDSVTVIVNSLTITGTDGTIICGDNTTLNTTTNYTGTGTLTYSWLPITGLDNSNIANPVATVDSNQIYTVTVTTPNGCTAADDVSVTITPMNSPEICIVSVDSTNKNIVIWNKPFSLAIDLFYIYRETNITNVYQKIGAVSYDSLSVFVDTNSYPDVQSNKYKISISDDCGLESEQSDYHKTMHLTINQGMGATWNLIWEPYEGFTVSGYRIFRGTSPDSLQLIGTTSGGGSTQYSDFTSPAGYIYYQVEVVSPNFCNPSKSYNSSRSNIATNNPNGINENSDALDLFSIYPNPAGDIITIENMGSVKDEIISIYNMHGQLVKQQPINNAEGIPTGQIKTDIDVSELAKGIYLLKLSSYDKTEMTRFVKK